MKFSLYDSNNLSIKSERDKKIKIDPSEAPTAILPPIPNINNNRSDDEKTPSETAMALGDQRVF